MFHAYAAVTVLALVLVLPSLVRVGRRLRMASDKTERNAIIRELGREAEASMPSLDALSSLRPWGTTQVRKAVGLVWSLLSLPVFLLRMAIAERWGVEVLWRLPFDLYSAWQLGWVAQGYAWAASGEFVGALCIALLVVAGATNSLLDDLQPGADGRPRLFGTPRHKLHLHEPVVMAFVVLAAFGCVYFSLGGMDPDAFSTRMTIVQSLYYSILVGTTVGFSDIQPQSDLLRAITAMEAAMGYLFIILFIAVHVGAWMERHRTPQVRQEGAEELER